MKILVAEDDPTTRMMLKGILNQFGYETVLAQDGIEAMRVLTAAGAPPLAIVDWMMPGVDGLQLCRRIKKGTHQQLVYIILLTGKTHKDDVVAGLEAGADDYITKPFDVSELRARVRVAERIMEIQNLLSEKIEELEESLEHVKTLQGTIPICAHCKSIRNDDDRAWQKLEAYIERHSDAEFSHSICPACAKKYFPDMRIYED